MGPKSIFVGLGQWPGSPEPAGIVLRGHFQIAGMGLGRPRPRCRHGRYHWRIGIGGIEVLANILIYFCSQTFGMRLVVTGDDVIRAMDIDRKSTRLNSSH